MRKNTYETPETERWEISLEEHFLDGSIQASRGNYTMDADEDWE